MRSLLVNFGRPSSFSMALEGHCSLLLHYTDSIILLLQSLE